MLYSFLSYDDHSDLQSFPTRRSSDLRIFLMSRKIILIKQELLLLVYELNRSGLLAENEKIRKQAVVIPALSKIGRAVQQEGRDRARMQSSAGNMKPLSRLPTNL